MVGESRDVFTKRLFDKKRISGVMCENPGGGTALLATRCRLLSSKVKSENTTIKILPGDLCSTFSASC